ncbi:Protein of unknown function [Pyronema omphalodes CBS 100304]|uniref:Uncharacterized protein n=1 Tax=Pyronema omphalodes (strain CBS 100304) TaxID=1076935 RepID=U4LV64_PYROM|nr:Protein of unknown function [Pyronema omphalodes CBS 100304]
MFYKQCFPSKACSWYRCLWPATLERRGTNPSVREFFRQTPSATSIRNVRSISATTDTP